VTRRWFPSGRPPRRSGVVAQAGDLWRSPAYEPSGLRQLDTRLARFHSHYGEDVLDSARRGDLDDARRRIGAWIAANPPRDDDAWHPYPLSTRIGSWVAALTLLPELRSPEFDESLWRGLRHLERNVEDDVLGNHVIRNARGLVAGGAAFGERRFVDRGLALLRRELRDQVLPDGGHYERSPVYHLVVLRDLLEVQAIAGPAWLEGPIERMRAFAAALSRPDGSPALFNDGGLDLAPRLDLPEPRPGPGLAVFPDTGYAVVRQGGLWLAFDCGAPAPPFLPAHAHADALSLQLWWDGRPALVDTGTTTYEPGPERDRLRSTAAHSTVAVDGQSQFETWRAFRSGPLPEVRLRAAEKDRLEASVAWREGVSHVRRVEWREDEVTVFDRVEGLGRHRIESRLVLAPGERVVSVEPEAAIQQGRVGERLGEGTPTDVLVQSVEDELPVQLGWRIRPV
jgi:uncharacterized heparinase superfamily protein